MTVRAHIPGGVSGGILDGAIMRRVTRVTLAVLALVGVPTAVVMLTGGPSSILFWIDATLLGIFAFTVGPWPLWVVLVIPYGLIMWIVSKVHPGVTDRAGRIFTMVVWVVGGTVAFMVMGPMPDPAVILPTEYPRLGALLVMTGAAVASAGLLLLAHRLAGTPTETPAPLLLPRPGSQLPRRWTPAPIPQEPEEEFWSPEPVVAWRAWRWTGTTLHGVVVEWPGTELEAVCDQCEESPGWSHPCGIYGVSRLDHLSLMTLGAPDVIGRVELSGLVVEHEIGYRASHARIIDLWTASPQTADSLTLLYPGIEVYRGVLPADEEDAPWPT